MREIRCPYCLSSIKNNERCYYIKAKDYEPVHPDLAAFLKPDKADRIKGDPFYQQWMAFGDEEIAMTAGQRIVKTEKEILTLKAKLESTVNVPSQGKSGKPKPGEAAGQNLMAIEQSGQKRKASGVTIEITSKEGYDVYTFREGKTVAAETLPACANCYNVIPEELFELPLITVALAASSEAGKTCLLLTWFLELRDALKGLNVNSEGMHFQSLLWEESGFQKSKGLREMVDDLDKGICPELTRQRFIPPAFMKVKVDRNGVRSSLILGLYDAAGETLANSLKGNEKVSYMSHMDGVVYLVDPEETILPVGHGELRRRILRESRRFFGENVRVLDRAGQSDVQSAEHKTEALETVLRKMLDGKEILDTEGILKAHATRILNAMQIYAGDNLKNMDIALALSKCDMLKDNDEVLGYDMGGFFFSDEPEPEDAGIRAAKRAYTDMSLNKLFSEKVCDLKLFNNEFRSVSLHMIAPLGCSAGLKEVPGRGKVTMLLGNYAPIHTNEPLIGLLKKLIDRIMNERVDA